MTSPRKFIVQIGKSITESLNQLIVIAHYATSPVDGFGKLLSISRPANKWQFLAHELGSSSLQIQVYEKRVGSLAQKCFYANN
jgi:hypothetical protein